VSIDDLLFAIILAGIGLSGAYLRAELILHGRTTAVQRIRELLQRDVHAKRVSLAQNARPRHPRTIPSPIQARAPSDCEGFGARIAHLCTRARHSSDLDSYMSRHGRSWLRP
jgi:hypothetical protein